MGTVTTCPSCKPDMNGGHATKAPNGLPWFYMNGDWMEFTPQQEEMGWSGPILSSYHYMLDVEIVSELATLLGKTEDAAQYAALASKTAAEFNAVYLNQGVPPAPAPPPGQKNLCGLEKELKKGGTKIELSCGGGSSSSSSSSSTIAAVVFVSFGTPKGSCAAGFAADPTCDSKTARALVTAACVGKPYCTLSPSAQTYGDPCTGTVKSMAVVVNCTGNGPAPPAPPPPPPSPPPPAAVWTYGRGQTENAVPLMHKGLVPPDKVGAVTQTLLDYVVSAGNHATTGFIGNKYILPALLQANQTQLLLEVALQTTLPSLGYQIAQGATTVWESWAGAADMTDPGSPSHNHHFMGGMGQFFWDSLIGIRCAGGGGVAFGNMQLGPQVTGHASLLSSAEGEVLTPHGAVKVSWSRSEPTGKIQVNCTVPPNSKASVTLPATEEVLMMGKVGRGSRGVPPVLLWSRTAAAAAPSLPEAMPSGIYSVQHDPRTQTLLVQLGSGDYSFSSRVGTLLAA